MKLTNLSDEFKQRLNEYISVINKKLTSFKESALLNTVGQESIVDAMWYSLSAGGKRIRPVLVLEFCRMCGGDIENALSAACAIEMIHTFSLIHDDLPSMDNDDYRRGQLSCHKAFNEAIALLAGDALENLAYNIILKDFNISDKIKVKLLTSLTDSVGIDGMIGGQVIDTKYDEKTLTEEMLLKMYSMKTSALVKSACEMGCIAADADDEKIHEAAVYAEKLGMAFQIIDDILDIIGSEDIIGKPVGSDVKSGKNTYASLNGVEKAKCLAASLTSEALTALKFFDDNSFLVEFTNYLLSRNS